MRYKEDFARRVLEKTDIVKVISQYTNVKTVNNTHIAKCPFHNDKAESIIINTEAQAFHCLDCGKSGNAATFLAELKKISLGDAIGILAKQVGMYPTQDDIIKPTNSVLKANLYSIYKDAAIFYNQKLNSEDGKVAMAYLTKRGINEHSKKIFGLGYAPGKGKELYNYLKAKGYDDELMITAGLIKVSETGPYDMFRNRLMFPIMDEQKRIIAFGGRVLADDAKPKYLNSPETPIFNKSTTLYGIHDIKGADKKFFILCEGNVDVIMLHQNGFKNSVATLGTAFTSLHVPVLQKYTKNLVLSFDSDKAGQEATKKVINNIRGLGMGIKVLSMEPFKDPDEFIKNLGADEYKIRIERGLDPMTFKIKELGTHYNLNNEDEKQKFLLKAVEETIESQEKDVVFALER